MQNAQPTRFAAAGSSGEICARSETRSSTASGDHVSFMPLWVFGALCGSPRINPLLDALVRHALAALKGGDRADDAGDLPFIDVEILLDGFGCEEGAAAAGALGELL
jgi:hypothetical protein